jgi:hypothetical protein
MFQEEERFMSDKEKADLESDFELVFDLEIPTGTPEQKAHGQAHDEMIRERNRKALADPDLDTDLPF